MILLSGFPKNHKYVWYSKFTGTERLSETERAQFYTYKELFNELLQFTANYIYEKIRKACPDMKKRDVRTLVVEAFKHDKTVACFAERLPNEDFPVLYIKFFDNSIIREFIENAEIVIFAAHMYKEHDTHGIGYSRYILQDEYNVKVGFLIRYYKGGANGNVKGTSILNNGQSLWDKALQHKLKELK